MVKLGLILSNDWEIYGDGSGDYFEIQHRPLEQLLAAADEFGAKVAVFAEVGQQFAHRKYSGQYHWAEEIASAWEEIVCRTLQTGHDVQLHWHPQWLDAHYADSTWQLNYDHWAISSLPVDKMFAAISRGKLYLESLLQPVESSYQCHSFRAGAYCIEPSQTVVEVLQRAGIQCDSSVTQGLFVPGQYDFRDADSHVIPWKVGSEGVKYRADDGCIIEMPIAAAACLDWPLARKSLGYYYTGFLNATEKKWAEQRDRMIADRYPAARQPPRSAATRRRFGLSTFWKAIARKTAVQLDYDFIPATVFVDIIEKIWKELQKNEQLPADAIVPIMASGHVKNMPDADNVRRILEELNARLGDEVIHWTSTEAVQHWQRQLGVETHGAVDAFHLNKKIS